MIFILNVLGAFCSKETLAPLAGQPRPSGASGTGYVHPYIPNQDQLPQHQTDHSCVTRGQAHNLRYNIPGNRLNLFVQYKQ